MNQDQQIKRETEGLLHSCGCKLEPTGGDQYQIVRRGSGKVLATGSLKTCYGAAFYMASSGQFQPEPVATGKEAYQAGVAMAKRLSR